MKASILLCDAVQVSEGKLHLLGAGWNVTGPSPATFGIAVLIEVPWSKTNERHRWELTLLTEDGDPLMLEGEDGTQAVALSDSFEVGRPPGARHGVGFNVPLAFNFQSLPLPPGARYLWNLAIDGATDEHWQAAFSTRPAD